MMLLLKVNIFLFLEECINLILTCKFWIYNYIKMYKPYYFLYFPSFHCMLHDLILNLADMHFCYAANTLIGLIYSLHTSKKSIQADKP